MTSSIIVRFPIFLIKFFCISIIFVTINASCYAKKAAIIIDYETKKILFHINENTLNHPASLAKMMTIYIVFDYLEKGHLNWNTKMSVSKLAASRPRSKLYLEEGSFIMVKDAVNALIIKSANDVATVVAEHISGSEREFAKLMTKYARKIGMKKTVFKNASGLNNRAQLTTAYEMAILSRSLISKFPNKYKLFNQKNFTWKDKTYKTHNRLMLKYEGADGIKTGYLASSGFQLALSVVRNNQRLIGVYFGGDTSKQRDQRLTIIMDKVFNNLQKKYPKNETKNKKTTSNKYMIVVGTFKYKKNAEKQIKIIKKNYPKTTDKKEAKIIKLKIGNGYLYETRFQFYSKKEAKYACSRLKMYDRDCFIRG